MPKLLYLPLFLFFARPADSYAQNPTTDSLLLIVEKGQEDTGTVIAYRMLTGMIYSSDPATAVGYGKSGASIGKKIGFDKGVAGCLLNIAVAYSSAGKLDSAILYIDTAIDWSVKVGEPARIALAFLNRADYKRQLGNMKEALKDCDTSMLYAEKANRDDTKARIYQTIGSVYHMQDNWEQSRSFYDRAYRLYEKGSNKRMMAISLNNLGNVFKHLAQYDSAINNFKNAIQLSSEVGDRGNIPMYYSNIGAVYFEKGDLKEAEENSLQSLALAREQENPVQITGSQTVLANIYLKKGKFTNAIDAATEAYILSAENKMLIEGQTAADILAEAYYKSGNYRDAYRYAQISKGLLDTVSRQKYDEEVARMQTSFKVIEKDREIELLAKDKLLQQQKLQRQKILIISSVAIAVLSLSGIWLLANRSKLKHRMKELELRNRIAADLHDEVGSSLSSIHMLSNMATLQENETAHKEILQRMSRNAKETMDKMGDIVWMIKPGDTEAGSLKQRMERFAYEICGSKNIRISMQLEELDKFRLTMAQRKNIYLIFKEALNNSVKYSGTEKMEVQASSDKKELRMTIHDHGMGFDPSVIRKGNGLDNMYNRAKELNGELKINSGPGKGTSVLLVFPV